MQTADVSLIKTLLDQTKMRPDKVFVTDIDDRSLTYRQTVNDIGSWAAAYGRINVGRHDHVVTMQLNSIDSMLGWLGLAAIGAIEAPINVDYRGTLLAHALNLTQARTMLVLAQYFDRLLDIAEDVHCLKQVIILDGKSSNASPFKIIGGKEFLQQVTPLADLAVPAPWDIMAILFTSGTTGPSKAVRLPWAQIHAMATGTYPMQDLDDKDIIYNPGPTYHVGAKVFPYMAALIGGSHVMRPYISASRLGEEYLKYGVTTGGVVPAWLNDPPHASDISRPLKNVLAPQKAPIVESFVKRFGCRRIACFNMTEVSCPIVFRTWNVTVYDGDGRMSCGVLRSGYDARVVDENDQPVAEGTTGELILRADTPWTMNAGYLNNPEATAQAWRNGWFHTGDAFIVDGKGNYFFIDRLKDCIRRRGENISSFEVEAYLNENPDVVQSAAIAVKSSAEPGANEEIKAVVVKSADSSLSEKELIEWLIPRMPRFMIPRYVQFVTVLPRTPTMKVRKSELRSESMQQQTWDREKAGITLPRI